MNYRDVLFYKYLHGSGGSQPAWDGATFSSYAKGTEQILPENEADPDSSPFLGDIRYPDGTRRNNYFLYRESPNTVDGQAKITRIQGNTVVFNQLIEDSTFSNSQTDSRNYVAYGFQILNGGSIVQSVYVGQISSPSVVKYLFTATANGTSLRFRHSGSQTDIYMKTATVNVFANHSYVVGIKFTGTNPSSVGGLMATNFMLIDLTQMGLDYITSVDQFTSLYPLPYYAYTQGKLLPFKGESLKTTNKNIFPFSIDSVEYNGRTITNISDGVITVTGNSLGTTRINSVVSMLYPGTYILSGCHGGNPATYQLRITSEDDNTTYFSNTDGEDEITITEPLKVKYRIICFGNSTNDKTVTFNPMLRYANVTDNTFEPYTTSTLPLPISTYFPTGMKSAGSVYDEITESKAITRLIGYTITGNETVERWDDNTSSTFSNHYGGIIVIPSLSNCKFGGLANGKAGYGYQVQFTNADMTVYLNSSGRLAIINDSLTTQNAWLSGITGLQLCFELATPTEQPISSQTQLQNQALSTILGKTVSVDSPEEPLNILLKGE